MGKLMSALWVDTYAADPMVPTEALLRFKEEAPYLAERREQSIALLRSRPTSRYVLDGAKVNWETPEVLRGPV